MRILDLSLFRGAAAFVALLACSLPSLAQLSTYNLTGASVDLGDNCFQLTPNATAQVGTVWANEVLDLEAPFHLQALMTLAATTQPVPTASSSCCKMLGWTPRAPRG